MRRVRVERHPLLFRVVHWLMFVEGLILGITGISLSEGLGLMIIERGLARSIHIVVGFAFIGTAIFFLYYFIASGEYRWFGLSRLPRAVGFLFAEIGAWFSGRHLSEPIRFNPSKGDYEEKVVPTEVLAWWGWFVVGLFIILTGLGLVFPEQMAWFNDIMEALLNIEGDVPTALPAVDGLSAAAASRQLHLVFAGLSFLLMVIHAYAAYVYGMVRSIIFGYRDEPAA